MQELFEDTGRFDTENADKYLIQLCKHFGHKVPAVVEGREGRVTFDMGEAVMQADDKALIVALTAQSDKAIGVLQAVIDDHLKRFAFREEFERMSWTKPAT